MGTLNVSAVNAFPTIDFSKIVIDEGVVDNFPSKEIEQTPMCSSSPLKSLKKDEICRSLYYEKYGR